MRRRNRSIDRPAHLRDPYYRAVVILNATPAAQTLTVGELAGAGLRLHPVLRHSTDPVVRTSSFDCRSGAFRIPARTAAVFVSEAEHGGGCR